LHVFHVDLLTFTDGCCKNNILISPLNNTAIVVDSRSYFWYLENSRDFCFGDYGDYHDRDFGNQSCMIISTAFIGTVLIEKLCECVGLRDVALTSDNDL
jgi:hypothetical protein